MKNKLFNALVESVIGFLGAGLYIVFKCFDRSYIFVWSKEIVFVGFCMALFFIKGCLWGHSKANFKQKMQEKKDKLFAQLSTDLRCYKCSSIIKPEDNSCSVCGWTWKL
jgi:hypothetical protein